jgi:type VI secretion system protein ImpE
MRHQEGGDQLQLCKHTVTEHIATVESQIRKQPGDASHRWALFQWLCVEREWDRAIRQLQVFGQLDADSLPLVHACRDLIRAERWRERVLAGLATPGYVLDTPAGWMLGLIAALRLSGRGELDAADDAREQALDAAPLVAGRAGETRFEWIADSDSRLGPICEIMTAGSYRWLALADITAWQIATPATLSDLMWARCTVTLNDGTVVRGFMPARYPSSSAGECDTDLLNLGRLTVWRETRRTGIVASGRKTWTTSAGDVGLFAWSDCTFGDAIASSREAIREAAVAAGTASR